MDEKEWLNRWEAARAIVKRVRAARDPAVTEDAKRELTSMDVTWYAGVIDPTNIVLSDPSGCVTISGETYKIREDEKPITPRRIRRRR